ncbi:sarcosine oxidase subunit gamma [Ancylobacter sp. A5.8]|uniref:sarcosine oxidase subunit gamma n=1 Tax=Ancylobacter gelatini TaxID=2919920 RepID=UPI001F4DB535|nr:sarcosine oxidase subunit gamma [Ancylobacter gelatini]
MADHSHHDPLAGIPVTLLPPDGHYGAQVEPGLRATRLVPAALASLAARRGREVELAEAAERAFGVRLIDAPRVSSAGGLSFIGTAPGRWMVLSDAASDLVIRLDAAFGRLAAITEQTDSALLYALSGPEVREVLAKGLALDLHPSVFAAGSAATTVFAHIGVTLWQAPEASDYRLLVARSYEAAFLRALIAAAAPCGFHLDGRG